MTKKQFFLLEETINFVIATEYHGFLEWISEAFEGENDPDFLKAFTKLTKWEEELDLIRTYPNVRAMGKLREHQYYGALESVEALHLIMAGG